MSAVARITMERGKGWAVTVRPHNPTPRYTPEALKAHSGFNARHSFDGRGQRMVANVKTGMPMMIKGPRVESRWMPHQSTREKSRRMG